MLLIIIIGLIILVIGLAMAYNAFNSYEDVFGMDCEYWPIWCFIGAVLFFTGLVSQFLA